jgi:hypothetical protein
MNNRYTHIQKTEQQLSFYRHFYPSVMLVAETLQPQAMCVNARACNRKRNKTSQSLSIPLVVMAIM